MDDKKENIAMAEKMGLHGIVFTSREQAVREMKNYGVRTDGRKN